MPEPGILIIDDDDQGRAALLHVLDAEGWRVRVVPLAATALEQLASGAWHLVIANVALTGLDTPLFATLKELALASAMSEDPGEQATFRARSLFLVPELAAADVQPILETEGVPYALKPIHLHDFLEKISDLLLEVRAIDTPIRRVKQSLVPGADRRQAERRTGPERRQAQMFTSREDYQMTEEELAEYERQEEEERRQREKEKNQR